MFKRNCEKCGKFYEGYGEKYCSLSCIWTGKKHTRKTKEKMSGSNLRMNLGKTLSKETKDKISKSLGKEKHPFWGKHRSKDTKDKISETRKNSGVCKGEKNPNYKGGITKIKFSIRTCPQYSEWVLNTFRRDNFTCQGCGSDKGGILEAHHKKTFSSIIKEYDIKTLEDAVNCKELWDINNGSTLCKKCHKKTDTYGLKRIKK